MNWAIQTRKHPKECCICGSFEDNAIVNVDEDYPYFLWVRFGRNDGYYSMACVSCALSNIEFAQNDTFNWLRMIGCNDLIQSTPPVHREAKLFVGNFNFPVY
jgi:hypothetical protein